ncbi:O-antigen ligase family protein [Anaerosacchariphilus polymeriproducens]|uniref:O-antigen ligase-related domain-containing protein n=1 Tax=Anaerosacchariphilus polymeriproducens TaxID=1812858 RepID=A0A371AZ06_9FIRM|nr:O-antigen ligase family protein [Anaerosacchariphilus polymeriproducens]RDU24791.1 hypothetical protein DWV06_02105 [Anaerosacchariphilus polymeriproducens]
MFTEQKEYNLNSNKINRLVISGVVFAALLLTFIFTNYLSFNILFIFGGALVVLSIFIERPKFGLYVFLMILPVSWTQFLDKPLMDISGLKLPVVIPFFGFLFLALTVQARKLLRSDKIFMFVWVVFYTITVARGYGYLSDKAALEGGPITVSGYIASTYLRALLLFLIMYFIAAYIQNMKEIKMVLIILFISLVIATGVMVYIYSTAPNLTDFEEIRNYAGDIVGMHIGYYANYFVFLVPITLLLALNTKWKICYLLYFMEIGAILSTFSRASYMVTTIFTVLILVISKRWKTIIAIVVSAPFAVVAIPDMVINRALTGLENKDLGKISAGRVQVIWTPIIKELVSDFKFLLIGNGKYGIFNTKAFRTGGTLNVNNAHNIFLDSICDGGIILAVFFICFFAFFIVKFLKTYRKSDNEFSKSILLGTCFAIAGFIMKGFTDGVFWAESSNAIIYVLLGLCLAVIYWENRGQLE